ncbi:MAG: dehydrogenase [Pseudomonadota bacterium]
MKHIINISLGSDSDDFELTAKFMGQSFTIRQFGTNADLVAAEDLLLKWNKNADVLCISGITYPSNLGKGKVFDPKTQAVLDLCHRLQTPVTTGRTLDRVSQEWSIRHVQFELGDNYFTNARVLFFSGMASATIATVMAEYTDNLVFADPILEDGIPAPLTSLNALKRYADKAHGLLKMLPAGKLLSRKKQVRALNDFQLKRAVKNATVLVVPHDGFFDYLEGYEQDELAGKIVITTTAYDDRVDFLTSMGVDVILDTTPKVIDRVVDGVIIEALMIAAMDIPKGKTMTDDLLEIISEQGLNPRIIYPLEDGKRVNRFAYLIHPLSQEHLKKIKAIEVLSDIFPRSLGIFEKAMAYSPPFVYSRVRGIKSPLGVEAEGWLIALGETSDEMQARDPGFTTAKILEAARKAKHLGAQVMGISMLPKTMQGTALDVGKYAVLPITTGNSYTASTALWATAEAVRRMGLTPIPDTRRLRAKAMVIGATGAVGGICAQLLALAFEEVIVVSRNMSKLLSVQEDIQTRNPGVVVSASTRADRHIGDMDVVVLASSDAGKSMDIMRVKPGCVITDITRPMIFSPKDVAKRQDVLVITGGEILLPGEAVEMKDIGLPHQVAYAGLAETIILALEGRFEDFTTGTDTQWEKVREIYKLGLKHGMKLASISGIEGILTDEDIKRVAHLALKQRKKQ